MFHESNELACRRCHKAGERGGEVGPDLTTIATKLARQFSPTSPGSSAESANSDDKIDQKVREYLLESIVLPTKTIAKGFDTVMVVTDDGRQHSGILQNEDDRTLRLMTPEGKLVAVPKIVDRRTSDRSRPRCRQT